MELTQTYLEQKLTELKQQHTQLIANVHAMSGAIQFCEQLLEHVQSPDLPAMPQD